MNQRSHVLCRSFLLISLLQCLSQNLLADELAKTATAQEAADNLGVGINLGQQSCQWSGISQADDTDIPAKILQANRHAHEGFLSPTDIKFGDHHRQSARLCGRAEGHEEDSRQKLITQDHFKMTLPDCPDRIASKPFSNSV